MDLLKSENDKNVTVEFHEACLTGDIKKVKSLLSEKEKINVHRLDENLTLFHVVRKGNADIVKILLSLGINVNEKGIGFTLLHVACEEGNLPIAEILLENGADIDAIDVVLKWTSLDIAVWKENTSIVKLLLKNGCKTHVRDFEGMTALEMAMKEHYIDVVKLFAFHNK